MLKRRLQPKELRDKDFFKIIKYEFENYVDRLSAEYILLGQAELLGSDAIMFDLKEKLEIECVFNKKDLDGALIKRGCYITYDTKRASQVFYDRTVGLFFNHDRTELEAARLALFGVTVRENLAKIATINPSPAMQEAIQKEKFSNVPFMRLCEKELFVRIITRQIRRGDDLTAFFEEMKKSEEKEIISLFHEFLRPENVNPFAKKIIEYRDGQAILRVDDSEAPEFIMAFVAFMGFALPEHRTAVLARLATLFNIRYT